MRFKLNQLLVALAAGSAGFAANAAITAEEAKALGTTLTAVGAEKAANKDGTIPAYTGGTTTPPAGFKAGDGVRPNPFAGEKPRLVIDAKSMAANADKLTEGTKALLQKYRFDLKYIDFLGRYNDNGTSVTTQNGLTTFLKDRGFVSLTFKTTF